MGTRASQFSGRLAKRLTVLMTVHDRIRHTSLEMELLKRARQARMAGATVFEADEGYGASGQVHRLHLASDDRPLAVVFIDSAERIDAFLEEISPLLHDVVATVEEIEILDI